MNLSYFVVGVIIFVVCFSLLNVLSPSFYRRVGKPVAAKVSLAFDVIFANIISAIMATVFTILLYAFIFPWAIPLTFGLAFLLYHPIALICVWLMIFGSMCWDDIQERIKPE